MPCTTILVGKSASHDGSTIVARNEDAPGGQFTPKRFVVVRPDEQPRHYRGVISHVEVELPDDPMRYTALPNALPDEGVWAEAGVNEANVSMSATETLTTNERVLAADPLVALVPAQGAPGEPGYVPEVPGGIGEEDMVTLVLPYVRSAREGVLRLGGLLERYGTYEMNGIAFSDVDEVWWLETVGGHHWIARRLPDDCYATIPNQLGLDSFDLADAFGAQRDHLCSSDLRAFIAHSHLDLARPGDALNPRDAFGSHSDADHVYNTPRAWDIQHRLNARAWAAGELDDPEADDIPWCRVPDRLLTIQDVKDALSLHYQGTPFDPYERRGDGGDAGTRGAYRPIGINRNCELSVVQIRPYAPAQTRALQWVALGCNVFNALVPFFANVDETPAYLANTGARVTTDSFYWANRLVAALADPHFGACQPHVERYQQRVPAEAMAVLGRAERALAEGDADATSAPAALGRANERVAELLRARTDELLGEVLREASLRMRNAFSRSDS